MLPDPVPSQMQVQTLLLDFISMDILESVQGAILNTLLAPSDEY